MSTSGQSLLIRDARIFTPDSVVEGDCLIEDGRIAEIGAVTGSADEVLEANGQWLWPGAIDGHVHFREPGLTHKEDWSTGSAAAVSGGVTTVFEMPNTRPTTTTVERLDEKRRLAGEKTHCNYGLFFGATPSNQDAYSAVGSVPGLKIFMGCSTGDLLVHRREDLRRVFDAWDRRICVHAENEERLRDRSDVFSDRSDPAVHSEIRDPETARLAVETACRLAVEFERDLHVLHLSTIDELREVERARQEISERNLDVEITCEVCPHHLFLDRRAYESHGTRVQMNPPLRSEEHRLEMWRGLEDGRIQMIATDHAPHTTDEKDAPYGEAPSGVPGVETMLPIMLDAAHRDLCTYEDVLEWLCHGPARVYGLSRRGQIRPGFWADLTLIDADMTRTVEDDEQCSRCGWSPWSGRQLVGWPTLTIVNGRVAYRRDGRGLGEIVGRPGTGREVDFD